MDVGGRSESIATDPVATPPPKGRCALVDNAKALLLLGVISWHYSRCGESNRCMPGLLPELIGTSPGLLNTLPKVLGSSILSGLMMLAGITQSTRPPSLWTVVRTLLPGLLIQFVIAPFFDFCVASTIPTNGHIWFLYSLALAQLILLLVGRSQAMLAVTLVMCLCASPLWHAVVAIVPALSGAAFDGLTWSSGEWFLPVGVRDFTYPFFFAFGAVVCPLPVLLALRQRCSSLPWLRAVIWVLNVCCWMYSIERLRLGGTNLFTSSTVQIWLGRLPQQLEMVTVSLVSPVALLMILPDEPVPILTFAGKSTLTAYLLHPFALKLVRPLLVAYVYGLAANASPADQTLAVLLEIALVPIVMLVVLCLVGNALYHGASFAVRHLPVSMALQRIACLVVLVVLAAIGTTLPQASPYAVQPAVGGAASKATAASSMTSAAKLGPSALEVARYEMQAERAQLAREREDMRRVTNRSGSYKLDTRSGSSNLTLQNGKAVHRAEGAAHQTVPKANITRQRRLQETPPHVHKGAQRLEFVIHSGWGNMNIELRNALDLGHGLGRRVVAPHIVQHGEVTMGSSGAVCKINAEGKRSTSMSMNAGNLVSQYAIVAVGRPYLGSFLALAGSPVDWAHEPLGSSKLEQKASGCCVAEYYPDTGDLRYSSEMDSCDLASCTYLVNLCLTGYEGENSTLLARLRTVKSKTLVFGSLFYTNKAQVKEPTKYSRLGLYSETDCEIPGYRQELFNRLQARLTNMGEPLDRLGSKLDGSFDAVHLRLGEGFGLANPVSCGPGFSPGCTTKWPPTMELLRWLDASNDSRPLYIASDLPSAAREMAEMALTRRRYFTADHQTLLDPHDWLLGYLDASEKLRAAFMAPLILDILMSVVSVNFFGNAGLFSTYTTLIKRVRICKAMAAGRTVPRHTQLTEQTERMKNYKEEVKTSSCIGVGVHCWTKPPPRSHPRAEGMDMPLTP